MQVEESINEIANRVHAQENQYEGAKQFMLQLENRIAEIDNRPMGVQHCMY